MKKLFDLIFKLPLIILMLTVLLFIGVSSVMASTDTMIVNQSGLYADVEYLYQNTASSAVNYKETRPFLTDIGRTALTTPSPEPTYHVGKINSYMI